MKKTLALLLALLLTVSALPALADTGDHVTISATYVDRGSTEIDEMYHFFCDKFNMDIDMVGIPWSALKNTNSVMIMGGTMYDWMMIELDYGTYLSYVDQGLIKALPENFREAYPNIARALDASGVGDYLSVDGATYGVPMPILFNFAPKSYYLNMQAAFYRVDWARELGFEWGASVTLSEFERYLKACVEKDMAGNGQTLGLSSAGTVGAYLNQFNDAYNGFVKQGDEYIWGPAADGVVEGIKALKKAYAAGLIDPDFYALDTFSAQNKLTDDQGVWHGGEAKNFWCINVFRPDMDEKAFERTLSLLDYLYTQEAEVVINMGIPGVDWTQDENGDYVSLLPAEYAHVRQKYPSGWFWRDTAICLDEFDLVNPSYSKQVLENINAVYDFRYASAEENGYLKRDNKVAYLDSEAMRNYSVDINGEVMRLVCDENISLEQIEAEWQKFIQANAGLWQPVVNDLNEQ